MARALEAEGGEKDDTARLAWKGKKTVAPWKRKQVMSGSWTTTKRAKVQFTEFLQIFSIRSGIFEHV